MILPSSVSDCMAAWSFSWSSLVISPPKLIGLGLRQLAEVLNADEEGRRQRKLHLRDLPQVQTARVIVDPERLRRVQLDHGLAFVPEQILGEAHFLPIRWPPLGRDADVLPALLLGKLGASADHHEVLAARAHQIEHAVGAIFRLAGPGPAHDAPSLELLW